MNKFNYDDMVTAKDNAPKELRRGKSAWIVGISKQEDRKGAYLEKFPKGVVYTIEFEDGSSVEALEADLL